jgi:hypothetical protein
MGDRCESGCLAADSYLSPISQLIAPWYSDAKLTAWGTIASRREGGRGVLRIAREALCLVVVAAVP